MNLVDPTTGEVYEVLPENAIGIEPYSYADFRRAQFSNERRHREALNQERRAIIEKAKAEARYREELAKAIVRYKVDHAVTLALDLAKGDEEVSRLREARDIADGMRDAARELLRKCHADRIALNSMGAWSKAADADGWQ